MGLFWLYQNPETPDVVSDMPYDIYAGIWYFVIISCFTIEYFIEKTKFMPPQSMVDNYRTYLVEDYKTKDTTDSLFPNQSFEFDNTDIKDDYDVNFIDLKQGIRNYIREFNEL